MGYDERGHCPMLVEGACSIYEHRPRTCRSYDCRVFPATGVALDDSGKELIAGRASRWRFSYPTERDEILHGAVRAAADYVRAHHHDLPEGAAPATATQLAVLAIELHRAFLDDGPGGGAVVADPGPDAVRVALSRRGATLRP